MKKYNRSFLELYRSLPWPQRLALLGLAVTPFVGAYAQTTYTWTGGTNNNWNNNANWVGSLNPGNGAADIVIDANTLDITADHTLNLDNGTTTLDRTVGEVIFGDTNAGGGSTTNNWTLGANGGAGSTPTLIFAVSSGTGVAQINNGTTTVNARIGGTSGLTKTGAGTLVLNNVANTLTGGYFISAGTLSFVSGSLGANPVTFTGNSTLTWNANTDDVSGHLVLSDGVTATLAVNNTAGTNTLFATALQTGPLGTGGIVKSNAGNATITAANTFTGGVRVNNGSLILSGGDNRLSALGAISFGNGANAGILQLGDASGPSNQTVTGLSILGTSNQAANAVVGGAATNSVFTINNTAAIPAAQAPTFGGGNLNANNLALQKLGAGSLTLDKVSSFTGDVTIGGGALIVSNSAALGAGPKTVTVSGASNAPSLQLSSATGVTLPANFTLRTSNDDAATPALVNLAGSNVIAGPIALAEGGYGGGQTRIQVQAGSLTLSGAIAPDSTSINPRTLILDGAAGGAGYAQGVISDTNSTSLSVSKVGAGAWTLTGANTFTGPVNVQAGSLTVSTAQTGGGAVTVADGAAFGVALGAPGQTLHTASLTVGSSAGAGLTFDFGPQSVSSTPLIQTASFATHGTVSVAVSGGGLGLGSFPLVQYGSSIGGDGFAAFVSGVLPAAALPNRVSGVLVNNALQSQIVLNITRFDVPVWTGAQSNVWDINDGPDPTVGAGSVNWHESTSLTATRYLQSAAGTDSAIFDDTPGVATNVVLGAALTPASVTVNASANNFIFSGAGKLSGTTQLLKRGAATLTLTNTGGNDFTGPITILGGAIQIGDGAAVGAGQLGGGAVLNNGTLNFFRPDNLTVANAISGAGIVRQNGSGILTLSGNNSAFTGSIDVGAGTLAVGNSSALGTGAAGTSVESGATLDLTGYTITQPIQLHGGSILSQSGASASLPGIITLQGGGTVQVAAGALTVSNPIAGAGGLTKTGNGTLILTAAQGYTGGTNISAGLLQLGVSAGGSLAGDLGAGDIALSGSGALSILRGDSLLNLAQNITGSSTAATAVTIGVTGANSPSGLVKFSGANTFAGNVTISGGALQITNSGGLGSGAKTVSIASAARPSLYLDGSGGDITLPSTISFQTSSDGAGTTTALKTAGAIVNLAGQNVIQGSIALINGSGGDSRFVAQAGTLILAGGINANGATGARNLLLSGGGQGIVSGAVTDGLSGSSTRVVTVQKDGLGTWTLSGSSTYTGATTVSAGTLIVSGSISSTSVLNVGGTLQLGASNQIDASATLNLAGGIFATAGFSEGDSATQGLGLFSLTANSTIDLGLAGDSSLLFAGLGTHSTGAQLTIANWLAPDDLGSNGDHLFFQGVASAFSAAYGQADVSFNGASGYALNQYDATHYELLPVPEPGAGALLLSAVSLGLGRFRRRPSRANS